MPGQPFTKVVPGNGTGELTFEVPAYFAVDLESVLAHVVASGAGDTTATLTVADEQGEPVATVPQGRTIAGGEQGRATWALRLAAEQAASAGGGGIDFDTAPQAGDWLYVETTGATGSPHGYGLDLRNAERVGIFSANDSVDVEAPNGQVTLSSLSGSGSGNVRLESDGGISGEAASYDLTISNNRGELAVIDADGHSALRVFGDSSMTFRIFDAFSEMLFIGGGVVAMRIRQAGGAILMPNLPTSDPGVTGQLWNNGGTVKVSP